MTKSRLTIKEAASALGLSEKQVRTRVKKGELEAEKECPPLQSP